MFLQVIKRIPVGRPYVLLILSLNPPDRGLGHELRYNNGLEKDLQKCVPVERNLFSLDIYGPMDVYSFVWLFIFIDSQEYSIGIYRNG